MVMRVPLQEDDIVDAIQSRHSTSHVDLSCCFPLTTISDRSVPPSLLVIFFIFFLSQAATKRTTLCREIAREVVGLAPYERRILDMIKTGGSSADKRVYKFAKRRLGSHKRALAKREDIKEVNSKQRARAAGV